MAALTRMRTALGADPERMRLLITIAAALALWALATDRFSRPPAPKSGHPNRAHVFRIDVNEIQAYPRSDAAMDYLNGMAILSGDGWVNWRDTNRWSVYRPGWGAFLAGLALLTGGHPATMQPILTVLLAAAAPVFMLLILHLYPGGRDLLLAIVATLVFIFSPFYGWWFQRTMMSEGPTMLLSLLFCLLTIRFCGRLGEWSWRQGFFLGLVGGALSLVRGQSRFAVLAVIALLALASCARLRRRLPFFVAAACGILVLVGPLYLKTSIHLRMPYAGTSYFALYSVLDYTDIGRSLGGGSLPEGVELSEREATRLLQERVRRGLLIGLGQPRRMVEDGFLQYSRFIHGATGTAARRRMPSRPDARPPYSTLFVLYSLTAVGLYYAWRRVGPAALAPLVFAAGYILPTVPLWFYRARFGVPISWVSLVYVAGALLVFGGARAGAGGRSAGWEATPSSAVEPVWPGRRFFILVGSWLALATAVLLWMDFKPLPRLDAQKLFADTRSRQVLADADVAAGADLIDEANRLLNQGQEGARLLAGVVVFPTTIHPGDQPVPLSFGKGELFAAEESYDAFYLVSPWKRGGSFRISQVGLRGGATAGLRPGDEVIVVREPGSVDSAGEPGVLRVRGAAVLPTRWAK